MMWGSFLIAAAALKTPTRNGYNAQGVNLNLRFVPRPKLGERDTGTAPITENTMRMSVAACV